MIEERKRLEAALEEFRKFVGTPEAPGSVIHREYVAATRADLAAVEERILSDEITKPEDFFTLLDLRGRRAVLRSNLTSFEDTVANLEARIQQMKLAEEQPNAAQQETNNDDEQEQ